MRYANLPGNDVPLIPVHILTAQMYKQGGDEDIRGRGRVDAILVRALLRCRPVEGQAVPRGTDLDPLSRLPHHADDLRLPIAQLGHPHEVHHAPAGDRDEGHWPRAT